MKKIKKLLAAVLCGTIASTSFAAVAYAEPEYIWIEAEDGTLSGAYQKQNAANASGGKALLIEGEDGAPGQADFTFTVGNAGEYDIKILGSSGNLMHLSSYKWSLDGATPTANTNDSLSDAYTIAIGANMNGQDASWFDITTKELTAGEHTLSIIADESRLLDSWVLHYFDCIAVTPSAWNWVPNKLNKPAPPVAVDGIEISEDEISLTGGEKKTLTAWVTPDDAANQKIKWHSTNSSVASVTNAGVVTGLSGGEATIIAESEDGGFKAECVVTVRAPEVTATWVNIADVVNTAQPGLSTAGGIVQIGNYEPPTGTVYRFDIPVTAPKAGEYDIYYVGSEHGAMHASSYSLYQFDGVGKGTVSDNKGYEKFANAGSTMTTLGIYWHKLESRTFDTNEHTISFEFNSPRSLDGKFFLGLKYLVLVPAGTKLKFDGNKAENVGEILMMSINIDKTETMEDLLLHKNAINGAKVTWESSNPDVIDENGHVTRPAYDEADAEVTLTAKIAVSEAEEQCTATKEFKIKVPKKGEYSVENYKLVLENGKYKANAKISENTGKTDSSAALIIALYDENGAMKAAKASVIATDAELRTASVEIDEEAGCTAEAFIWTDFIEKKLIENSLIKYTK